MGPRPGHQSRVVVTWRRRPMYAEAAGQDPARANPAATRTRCAFGTAQPLIAKVISSLCARNKAIADGRIDVDRFFVGTLRNGIRVICPATSGPL